MKKSRKVNKNRSKNAKKKIILNKNMTFAEIMQKYPESSLVFMKKGMHCFGCSMASGETLEQGAIMHGINPDSLVNELNNFIQKNKK